MVGGGKGGCGGREVSMLEGWVGGVTCSSMIQQTQY